MVKLHKANDNNKLKDNPELSMCGCKNCFIMEGSTIFVQIQLFFIQRQYNKFQVTNDPWEQLIHPSCMNRYSKL